MSWCAHEKRRAGQGAPSSVLRAGNRASGDARFKGGHDRVPHFAGRDGLRAILAQAGYQPETDTDTETVAMLTQMHLDAGKSPVEAAQATIAQLEGAFALAFLFDGEEDLMIAARKGSPLAIGHGENEMFIGSDAIALAPMTDTLTYLEEGDWAVITRKGAEIFDMENRRVNREAR